jgi:acetoin utilization deacetylase AcuC-like enzyme
MLVIENDNFSKHNPHWKFTLGPDTYETRDTPRRVEVIRQALEADPAFEFIKAERFPERALSRLHPYHDYIKAVSESLDDPSIELYPDLFPGEGARLPKKIHPLWGGIWCTDAVTPLSMHTYEVARGSAEAAMTGAELLRSGGRREVYALCRPSGHHAGPRVFGGYCYFNNAASAADLLSRTGRVAVLDLDYHHGNGTQEFFQERKDVLTCSIHADPDREYPYFWGYAEERGVGQARGTNLNLPLPLGTTDDRYVEVLDRAIDAIRVYAPDFLVLAAGFDTYAKDPIGGFALTVEAYPELGRRLGAVGLPTLICQEGGYNTDVLGQCVHGLLTGFLDGR